MLRAPESKTLFWRSSWCGGRGCWWRSSRMRFMGISLPLGGEGALSPHRATTQRGQEPSGRKDGRFSAALKAEGGVHRPFGRPTRGTCAYCINRAGLTQGGIGGTRLLHEDYTGLFTGVRGRGVLRTSRVGGSPKFVGGRKADDKETKRTKSAKVCLGTLRALTR